MSFEFPFIDSFLPFNFDAYPPVVSRTRFICTTVRQKSLELASSPPSSTRMYVGVLPIDRRTEINQRKIVMGGRFDLVGKPHGYDEAASTIVSAALNFRTDQTLKKVKSRWRRVPGGRGTSLVGLRGILFPFVDIQIGHGVRSGLYVFGRSVKCCSAHICRILSLLI